MKASSSLDGPQHNSSLSVSGLPTNLNKNPLSSSSSSISSTNNPISTVAFPALKATSSLSDSSPATKDSSSIEHLSEHSVEPIKPPTINKKEAIKAIQEYMHTSPIDEIHTKELKLQLSEKLNSCGITSKNINELKSSPDAKTLNAETFAIIAGVLKEIENLQDPLLPDDDVPEIGNDVSEIPEEINNRLDTLLDLIDKKGLSFDNPKDSKKLTQAVKSLAREINRQDANCNDVLNNSGAFSDNHLKENPQLENLKERIGLEVSQQLLRSSKNHNLAAAAQDYKQNPTDTAAKKNLAIAMAKSGVDEKTLNNRLSNVGKEDLKVPEKELEGLGEAAKAEKTEIDQERSIQRHANFMFIAGVVAGIASAFFGALLVAGGIAVMVGVPYASPLGIALIGLGATGIWMGAGAVVVGYAAKKETLENAERSHQAAETRSKTANSAANSPLAPPKKASGSYVKTKSQLDKMLLDGHDLTSKEVAELGESDCEFLETSLNLKQEKLPGDASDEDKKKINDKLDIVDNLLIQLRQQQHLIIAENRKYTRNLVPGLTAKMNDDKTQLDVTHPQNKDCDVSIRRQDMFKSGAEVIVNAANDHLQGGSGIDGAIHRAAGGDYKKAHSGLRKQKAYEDRFIEGHAAMIESGKLKNDNGISNVIVVAGPRGPDSTKEKENQLYSCYYNALQLAYNQGKKSIAFPAISTGRFKFPADLAAKISLKAIDDFLTNNKETTLTNISIHFLPGDDANNLDIYQKVLNPLETI